eukprot:CAMPEP_0172527548 /NCGR_PEP_ID=MMETSP1067-20121228/2202_1 /TAXON_ID=265564 ORGANISM="Thalassiosira punctigera, Strain Tpunct2005C2" /NCGR_SAMPLE_ID=MMETSP1067 /ASSEMBLY_ACC=CAM_ASM_000444 /LENGTH=1137 /DNA_ID=CAMNT_0013311301 /DNA_START=160 /DNA_END=3573 /DNA_ORIENTATION=-
MPTLTGIDDGAVLAPAPASSTKSTGGAGPKPNPEKNAKKPAAKGASSHPVAPPPPPPAATEVQLKMWHAVLLRRRRQIQRLSHSHLLSFANEIISDILSTRYETNLYSTEMKGGDKENNQEVDLISGHYKSLLLTQQPPPTNISADEIGLHLLALFYRSVDSRLPSAMRKHGIDALRRACQKLEFWLLKREDRNNLKVTEATEGVEKQKRIDSAQNYHGKKTIQSESRAEISASHTSNDSGPNKKMRTDPPEFNSNLVAVLPRPQGDGGEKKGDKEGGKSDKGVSLPPQPQQRPDRISLEKDITSSRSAHTPAPQRNTYHGEPAQKASTQIEPTNGQDKSEKSEVNDFTQPKQNSVRVTQEFKSELGNRSLPPQQGSNENSQENRSVRSLSSSKSAIQAPPQPGPSTVTQSEHQHKKPSQPNTNNNRVFWASGSEQWTDTATSEPSQARSGNEPRKEKSGQPTSPRTASNAQDPHKEKAVATPQDNARQVNNSVPHGAQKLSKSKTATAATSSSSQRDPHKGNGENAHAVATKFATTPCPSTESQKALPQANGEDTCAGIRSDDEDVIDLTEETPTIGPPRSQKSTLVSANVFSTSCQAIKQSDEENKDENPVVPKLLKPPPPPPSPPASPLPLATIHNPPPSPQPKPKPFSERCSLTFKADDPIASGSLKGRTSCVLSFDAGFHLDGSGSCLNDEIRINVNTRLQTWDPYWKIVEELGTREIPLDSSKHGCRTTPVGTRTTPCVPAHQAGPLNPDYPSSCASVHVDLPKEVSRSKSSNRDSSGKSLPQGYRPWGVRWGSLSHPYKDEKGRERDNLMTGDRRLVVRTLPLQRTSKDVQKRADGHLWPKGSFIQLKQGPTEQILSILQRKQQSHAHSEWKGISHPLDLTVKVKTTNVPFQLKLCSKEIVENSTGHIDAVNGTLMGSYALHVAICEYIAPDDLYDRLMGNSDGDVTIPKISLRSARKMAKEYLADQTVLIDDSDDEDRNSSVGGKSTENRKSLTFSLLCPISKTAMKTPVRGRHCKHMQCMDLGNFLHANKIVTGGRWRCGACESFVNVRDLVHCGLFQAMVDSVGSQVSGARDRVSLCADGSWKLLDENRLRYNKRGGNISTASNSDVKTVNAGSKMSSSDLEVIELV